MTEQQQQYFLKQGFSQKQIEEIALGMENGVPVSVYAFKELMPQNMYQIRRGLEEGFDKIMFYDRTNPECKYIIIENKK